MYSSKIVLQYGTEQRACLLLTGHHVPEPDGGECDEAEVEGVEEPPGLEAGEDVGADAQEEAEWAERHQRHHDVGADGDVAEAVVVVVVVLILVLPLLPVLAVLAAGLLLLLLLSVRPHERLLAPAPPAGVEVAHAPTVVLALHTGNQTSEMEKKPSRVMKTVSTVHETSI